MSDELTQTPRASLLSEVRAKFVTSDRYVKYLAKCGKLVDVACGKLPPEELAVPTAEEPKPAETTAVVQRKARLVAMCAVAEWFDKQHSGWENWWKDLTTCEPLPDGSFPEKDPEPVRIHLIRLGRSLGEAEPYRTGADAMRNTMKQGKDASKIEKEQARRTEIIEVFHRLRISEISPKLRRAQRSTNCPIV